MSDNDPGPVPELTPEERAALDALTAEVQVHIASVRQHWMTCEFPGDMCLGDLMPPLRHMAAERPHHLMALYAAALVDMALEGPHGSTQSPGK